MGTRDLKQKVMKGFAWTTMQRGASQLISFLVFVVLARLLDPENFGLVAMAIVAIAFFELFTYFGFGSAIIQREQVEEAHLNTAFWVDIGASLVIMSAAILSAGWLAALYNEVRLETIIQALSLTFFLSALSNVQTTILRRNMAFKPLAIRTVSAQIIGGIVGITLALQGFGVWSLVARQLATSVISTIILWSLSDWRPGLDVSYKHFKDLFGFSVNMMGASIVDFFSYRSDSFLIGYFLGPVALGYYTIAYRLIRMLTEFLGGTVTGVVWPAFARLQNEVERLRSGFYTASQMLALVVFPVFLGIFATASDLVPIMFGDKWGQSVLILQVLVFIGIVRSISRLYDTILVGLGRPDLWLRLKAATSIVSVVAFIIAMRWGVIGVAIAYVIVSYVFVPPYLYFMNRLAGISAKKYLGALSVPAVSAVTMAIVLFAINGPLDRLGVPMVKIILLVAAGLVSYVGTLVVVSPKTLHRVRDLFVSVSVKDGNKG